MKEESKKVSFLKTVDYVKRHLRPHFVESIDLIHAAFFGGDKQREGIWVLTKVLAETKRDLNVPAEDIGEVPDTPEDMDEDLFEDHLTRNEN